MILIVDDDVAVQSSLKLLLESNGIKSVPAFNEKEAMDFFSKNNISLIILDMNFTLDTSGNDGLILLQKIREVNAVVPIILITGWATIELAVEGIKAGANDFINKPWNNDHLLQTVRTLLTLKERQVKHPNRKILDKQYDFKNIIGEDEKILEILETIGRIAETDAPVLITGESGTGKELIAEAIHHNSLRASKPFIKVNLGGISTSLFESEMFGHIRGAFTDARNDRVGRFEMANKGTIFLDEIGDLDMSSQVKLLRVLQDRTYEVLGSSKTRTVDVRVICATNKNLHEMVAKGTFREDLLYRINLISVKLPSLRQRSTDIPLLVKFLVDNLKEIYNRPTLTITPAAMKWLQQLPFPGNIRQLKNLVERSLLVSKKNGLDVVDFQSQLETSSFNKGSIQLPEVGTFTLEETEVLMIKQALDFHQNKISKAAKSLGLTRSALYRRLEKYNIPYNDTEE
ncbi:MAG TPA: sigma-54 dependent transcriptional regulator [Cytophagaceae bacterium]|jgi:DNA-binding NtrC family response regulator